VLFFWGEPQSNSVDNTIKVQATDQGDGYFVAEARGPFESEDLGVVILVETLNIEQNTDVDRQYAFRGSEIYENTFEAWSTVFVISNR
jgi:hypothetical protein